MSRALTILSVIFLVTLVSSTAIAAPTCPISYGALDDAKPNKLYIYFPASDDATYPEFGVGGSVTSPAHRFDVSELGSYTGTAADLRNAIFDVVTDDYCEFNVRALQTTTAPPTTFPRRNTVAIGTDSNGPCGNEVWGQAQAVDTGDPTIVDFARVWAGSYQNCAGGTGGALNGTNSTLQRWARSIGGTVAHEGGHNYGMSHADGLVLATGEDALVRHLMAQGSNYSYEDRAGYRRHFSNREYSLLASNVGLSIQTMWNWDLVNPNAQTAFRLRMSFLSVQPSLILSWSYSGDRSPWINPAVTGPSGTTTFKGTTYNRYQIEWSTAQAWTGGSSGQVPGGGNFHVGATFSSINFSDPDAIIITDVVLLDNAGNPLALHPRLPGYDAGTLDTADASMNVRFFNFAPRELIIQEVLVQELPRVISLDAMVPGAKMVDVLGHNLQPWRGSTRRVPVKKVLKRGDELKIPVARLNQKRHVVKVSTGKDCDVPQDSMKEPDVARCGRGIGTDLFPATTLYITATVVEPNAKYWNRERKRYVNGPLTTKLFYQIAGRHPDFNRNGIDDYIDILNGRSKDQNGDGIPDEVQKIKDVPRR
jgi:hypothetical protein